MRECNFIKLRRAMQNHEGEMYGEPVDEYTPLIHGHWITVDYDDGTKASKCSNCKGEVKYFEYRKYKWCPHCGAKMDEKFFSVVSDDTAPATKVIMYVEYLSGKISRYSVTSETAKKIFSEFGTVEKNYIIFEVLPEKEGTNVVKDTVIINININNISCLGIVEYCDEEAGNEPDQTDKM